MADNYISLNVEHYLRNGVLKGIHKDLNNYCRLAEANYKPLEELVPIIKQTNFYSISENLDLTKIDKYNRAVIRLDLKGRTLSEWIEEEMGFGGAFVSLEIWRNDLGNFGAWLPLYKDFSSSCPTQFVTDNTNKASNVKEKYTVRTYSVEGIEGVLGNVEGESADIYIGKYNFDYGNGSVKLRITMELDFF